jgi:copper homeostasis protein (lipoprotein)
MLAVCLVLAACGDDGGSAATQARTPMPAALPGTYSGTFPCSNCAAIDAALWLREDRRFVFRQRYLGDSGAPDGSDAFGLGQWIWDDTRAELVLHGAGPERRFRILADGQLEWLLAATEPHVLQRDDVPVGQIESMPVRGVAVVTSTAATFRECQTQLELAVAVDEGLSLLRRQHRAFGARGRPALTSAHAHVGRVGTAQEAAEVWVIDAVESVNPDAGC